MEEQSRIKENEVVSPQNFKSQEHFKGLFEFWNYFFSELHKRQGASKVPTKLLFCFSCRFHNFNSISCNPLCIQKGKETCMWMYCKGGSCILYHTEEKYERSQRDRLVCAVWGAVLTKVLGSEGICSGRDLQSLGEDAQRQGWACLDGVICFCMIAREQHPLLPHLTPVLNPYPKSISSDTFLCTLPTLLSHVSSILSTLSPLEIFPFLFSLSPGGKASAWSRHSLSGTFLTMARPIALVLMAAWCFQLWQHQAAGCSAPWLLSTSRHWGSMCKRIQICL